MEANLKTSTPFKHRIKHRCGHFLGEWRNGTIYVTCGRCKELTPLVLDERSKILRIITSELKVPSTVT